MFRVSVQFVIISLIISNLGCGSKMEKPLYADMIFIAPKIYYHQNDSWKFVNSLVVKDGNIVAIGDSLDLKKAFATNEIHRVGGYVFPGLIDAHCHFLGLAQTLMQVDLSGSISWDEVLIRCEKFAKENPDIPWITGRGWDESLWANNQLPENSELNRLFPNKPVFIRRVDGHAGIANKKALEMAGITAQTKIEGGVVYFNTGILIDNAMQPVSSIIPPLSNELLLKGAQKAAQICNAYGLTTLADAGMDFKKALWLDSLISNNILSFRLYAMLSNNSENIDFAKNQGAIIKDAFRLHSFKFFADGALGSMGAKLKQPYCGSKIGMQNGLILTPPDELETTFEIIKEIGFQAHTHCIGDSANRLVLDLYNKVLATTIDSRWRIEHAQVIDPADFELFGNFHIIPSIQPVHATSDMRWAENRLCEHRLVGAYAYKRLLNQTGLIAIGTDFPVESPDPFANFYAAVARKNKEHIPEGGFLPTQKLTREQTLNGMTHWAAYSLFMDDMIGNLRPDMKADFIELDLDLLQCKAELIPNIKVQKTYVNGKKVFDLNTK